MLELKNREIRTPAICVSVIGENMARMEDGLNKAAEEGADLAELRLDKLESLDRWKDLLTVEVPMIVTNRSEEEGGFFEGGEEERISTLIEALEAGVECVDVELSAEQSLRENVLDTASEEGASVILSAHYFEKVPTIEDMLDQAEEMEAAGADIAKIIGCSQDSQESLRMLDFLIQAPERVDIPVIGFAMGSEGEFTRLAAPLLGSPITYASLEEKAAPGQLDFKQVREVLNKYRK